MLRGIGTSRGIGIGHVLIIDNKNNEVSRNKIHDTEQEKERFFNVREQFIKETQQLLAQLEEKLGNNDKNALVLKNQIYLAKDITTENEVCNAIEKDNICAEAAIEDTCDKLAGIFAAMDNPDMQQRVSDIVDMKDRMIQIMQGTVRADLTNLPENTVIVAKEIQPSMTASMDTAHVVGIVAEKGGDTAHASILARALEIPAVLSVKDVMSKVHNDDQIIVDGAYGEVFVNPTPRTLSIYDKKKKKYEEHIEELRTFVDKSTQTADGRTVILAANIGGAAEASKAVKEGAEGVGLFRTEFLFLNKNSLPTEEEQFQEYKKAAVLMKGKQLTIRTLDIGGDKDIPYMGLTRENNPFLGYRAIRFCLDRVDIFTTQLRAILRASAFGNIRIMVPMVTSVGEIQSVKSMVRRICKDLDRNQIAYDNNIKIGVMIETPAAAVMADVFATEADFFSIGTNDLTQYTIAVDRCNENVAYLYSAFNPAVLRLIKRTIVCAHEAGIEVGMCGEAAANPMMVPLLLAYGLDEFSVSTGKVLETRKSIADWTIKEAEQVTKKVMTMSSEKEVTDYLSDYFSERKKK